MAPEQQVAGERMIVRNPTIDDPNAGVIIAAGDPLPAGFGLIQNTPNKVDAAANYDVADAADQAGAGARPATTVVAGTMLDPEAAARQREIAERVAENTAAWGEAQRASLSGEPPVEDAAALEAARQPAEPTPTEPTPQATAPADLTVAELDAAYGTAEGYPKSGNKAEKVAFATAKG